MSLTLQYLIVGVAVAASVVALWREVTRKGHRRKKCQSCDFNELCSRKDCNIRKTHKNKTF